MAIVAVHGGREYDRKRRINQILDAARDKLGLTSIVTIGSFGTGHIVKAWADSRKVPAEVVKAHWGKHGAEAGAIQNKAILGHAPEILIAFPGDDETADIIRRANEAGIRVIEVDPEQHKRPEEGKLL